MSTPVRPLSVVVAGGGTAGHIEPAMNVADFITADRPGSTITALGTAKGLETRLVPARGYRLELIPPVPLPRKPSKELVSLPGRVSASIAAVAEVLDRVAADVVVGFGGYVSLPAYLAARRAKVPYVVHEANAKPGLANRIGARFTPFVGENYAGSLPKAHRVGLPLRTTVTELDRAAQRSVAAAYFDLDESMTTLLVFGGSQGARRLNEAVWAAVPDLTGVAVQILHAYGPKTEPPVLEVPGEARLRYRPVPYIDRMDLAYAAADLAVCRSGAMTCGEVAAVGLPAVYVPFPIGNGEQRFNALPVVEAGGGMLVDDADLTAQWLTDNAVPLLQDPPRLSQMAQRAARYGVRDGSRRLAELVYRAAESGRGGQHA